MAEPVQDIKLTLSVDALRELAQGNMLQLTLDELGIELFIRCDEAAVQEFRRQIYGALMQLLPSNPTCH